MKHRLLIEALLLDGTKTEITTKKVVLKRDLDLDFTPTYRCQYQISGRVFTAISISYDVDQNLFLVVVGGINVVISTEDSIPSEEKEKMFQNQINALNQYGFVVESTEEGEDV